MANHPLTSDILAAYAKVGDPTKAPQMQKYMKSETPYRGIGTPQRREINREIFKRYKIASFAQYDRVVRELWDAEYREDRYASIAVAMHYRKFQVIEALTLYRMMIETGAWWDYVDTIAIHLVGNLLRIYPDKMKNVLNAWIVDDHLWIRRTAILAQNRFKSDTDQAMLFDFCRKCLHEDVFWIRKAIGWALRDYSKSNPEAVRRFVEQHREDMSGVTLREAVKYI